MLGVRSFEVVVESSMSICMTSFLQTRTGVFLQQLTINITYYKMFHQGDLQSGIAAAVQQSKAVLCFVYGMQPSQSPQLKFGEHIG